VWQAARHTEVAGRRIAVDNKTNRQTFGVILRFFIAEIAVALQLVTGKRLINVQTA
jgi:hypothetical protein